MADDGPCFSEAHFTHIYTRSLELMALILLARREAQRVRRARHSPVAAVAYPHGDGLRFARPRRGWTADGKWDFAASCGENLEPPESREERRRFLGNMWGLRQRLLGRGKARRDGRLIALRPFDELQLVEMLWVATRADAAAAANASGARMTGAPSVDAPTSTQEPSRGRRAAVEYWVTTLPDVNEQQMEAPPETYQSGDDEDGPPRKKRRIA